MCIHNLINVNEQYYLKHGQVLNPLQLPFLNLLLETLDTFGPWQPPFSFIHIKSSYIRALKSGTFRCTCNLTFSRRHKYFSHIGTLQFWYVTLLLSLIFKEIVIGAAISEVEISKFYGRSSTPPGHNFWRREGGGEGKPLATVPAPATASVLNNQADVHSCKSHSNILQK